jgi:transcriptional regulator with XRE-family HTH domain
MKEDARARMKYLRVRKGYSFRLLGIASGVSTSSVWHIENTEDYNPSAVKLLRIANALEVTIQYLLDDWEGSVDDAVDARFFNKYREASSDVKLKLRLTLDVWTQRPKEEGT